MNLLATASTNTDMDAAMTKLIERISALVNTVYPYLLIGVAAIILIWGIYIGVRVAIAHKNEEQINARGMIKNLVVGIIVMFVLMIAIPLVMSALCSWAGLTVDFGYLIGFEALS